MTKTSKKALRQEAIKAEKKRRIQLRKQNSPINQKQLLSLIEYVGGKVMEHGHKNDLSYTSEWAHEYKIDFDILCSFLNSEKLHDDFKLFCEGDPYELFGATDTRLTWMPLQQEELSGLLDFLDEKLPNQGCNHDYKITQEWLQTKPYNVSVVLAALLAKGGGCDCEIIFNVDAEKIYPNTNKKSDLEKHKVSTEETKKKIKRSLVNPFNWNLSKLSKPWKIANLYDPNDPITLQFGKKSELKIIISATNLPNIKTSPDSFWTQLWCERYPELENGSCFSISRDQFSLPDGFHSVLVKSLGWIPVICWIKLEGIDCHLEVRTSSAREAGDIQEVEKLIFDFYK